MKNEYGHERSGDWEFHEVNGVEMMFWMEYEGGLSLEEQIFMLKQEEV